jgi:hypothetical protein
VACGDIVIAGDIAGIIADFVAGGVAGETSVEYCACPSETETRLGEIVRHTSGDDCVLLGDAFLFCLFILE